MDNRFADRLAALRSDTKENLEDLMTRIKVREMIEEKEEKNRKNPKSSPEEIRQGVGVAAFSRTRGDHQNLLVHWRSSSYVAF